ncbi:bifunctional helix-turn-helix transcriptional regulator/GNAT family N-acetyltransferase [Pseudonocardia sp. CA-107938]|uniref:bifunctional helix-turn-helix transcriptional regulator/GNAT family N-acetyltransferase n=1 Tax=Pseudonocardia sp. CA-107938 TaxID=3240021 RepID=UPI003D8D781D
MVRESEIAVVRGFNRTVTQRVGALDDAYLARGRSLGQSRLLWEIGPGGGAVRDLRDRLGLDSGYLSRLLRGLEEAGLVTVVADGDDARTRTVRLTPAGEAERAELDRLSDALAGSLLEPLDEPRRARLVAAMAEVDRLLTAGAVRIEECDPHAPRADAALAAYTQELDRRFAGGFARPPGDADRLTPPAGLFLVAVLGDETVGCGGLAFADGEPPLVKRLWVAPSARGLGLATRLMAELEGKARARGADRVRLDTNASLTEAVAMYRRLGYREVPRFHDDPYSQHFFEKSL